MIQTRLRVHLLHHHVKGKVLIMNEGDLPHLHCLLCDILVPWEALNGLHLKMDLCSKGLERKRLRLVVEAARAGTEMEFLAYVCPLTNVA